MLGAEACNVKSSAKDVISKSRHKMVEEGWGDDKTPVGPPPLPHLAERRVVLLVEARRLPAVDVRHKPSDQIVTELERWIISMKRW